MNKKLLIRDTTLRDGQQSQFATRMSQSQVDRVLDLYKEANFYATEVWGGAVPDSVMRYLNENPWDRLEKIKAKIGDASLLTALSRGRNLFGYNPYPDSVIEGFCKNSIESGLSVMRIFDALNDVDNMVSTIKFVKQYGGIADCAVCFTVDPVFTTKEKFLGFFQGKKFPPKIFDVNYFIEKAVQMRDLGASMISIKDMAGLIPPHMAGPIVKGIKSKIKDIPLDFHTHCTPGYGISSPLVAMVSGVDIVDTAIFPFAGGPSNPPFEIIQIFAQKLGLDTGVNLPVVAKIHRELIQIRQELDAFDQLKIIPKEFDITNYTLPAEIEAHFDGAIDAAKKEDYDRVQTHCLAIEAYFNFPAPDEDVKAAEIPGGMYTNMLAQLKAVKLDHLFKRVLKAVPQVRLDAGLVPLVTPTSQIVGQQAVNCIIDENNAKPWYSTKSNNFVNLVKGNYGKTPYEIDPDFREKLCGTRVETAYDNSNYQKQPNVVLKQYGNVTLASNEKEELLLELFPSVAENFLEGVRKKTYQEKLAIEQSILDEQERIAEEKFMAEKEAYNKLTPEEKLQRLMDGMGNYWGC